MQRVYIFDFDGTLTKMPLEEVVNNDLYKQVTERTYDDMQKENTEELDLEQRREEILNKINTTTNTDLFHAADGAVAYLRTLLNDPNNTVAIISKNYGEYIQAVLQHNGMTLNEINTIMVMDQRFHEGDKATAIQDLGEALKEENLEITAVTIFDNSLDDCTKMVSAASECFPGAEGNIHAENKKPGKFEFGIDTASQEQPEKKKSLLTKVGSLFKKPEMTAEERHLFQAKKTMTSQLNHLIKENKSAADPNFINMCQRTVGEIKVTKDINDLINYTINVQHAMVNKVYENPLLAGNVNAFKNITDHLLDNLAPNNKYLLIREDLYYRINTDLKNKFAYKENVNITIDKISSILYSPKIKDNETFNQALTNLINAYTKANPSGGNNPLVNMMRDAQERMQELMAEAPRPVK